MRYQLKCAKYTLLLPYSGIVSKWARCLTANIVKRRKKTKSRIYTLEHLQSLPCSTYTYAFVKHRRIFLFNRHFNRSRFDIKQFEFACECKESKSRCVSPICQYRFVMCNCALHRCSVFNCYDFAYQWSLHSTHANFITKSFSREPPKNCVTIVNASNAKNHFNFDK